MSTSTVQDLFVRERIQLRWFRFAPRFRRRRVTLTQAYILPHWDDDDDRLAFSNGVLEISTSGEFSDHNPENYTGGVRLW